MDPFHLIGRVDSKKSFLDFLEALKLDFEKDRELAKGAPAAPFIDEGPCGWRNFDLAGFLDAMHAWASDTDALGEEPSWRAFAEILYGGKIYE